MSIDNRTQTTAELIDDRDMLAAEMADLQGQPGREADYVHAAQEWEEIVQEITRRNVAELRQLTANATTLR